MLNYIVIIKSGAKQPYAEYVDRIGELQLLLQYSFLDAVVDLPKNPKLQRMY
jgi:hypothetical protein